jgi:hydroxymethylpyrimidine pyrophosphatase-like HAD family hydrolase
MSNQNVDKSTMKKLPFIAAIDFDGTLVEDKFPEIGEANTGLFLRLKEWQDAGIKLVLWTCRDNNTEARLLDKAIEFCKDRGIVFDAVNENIKEVQEMFSNDTRKIYANVYLDDKSLQPFLPSHFKYDIKDFEPWHLNLR